MHPFLMGLVIGAASELPNVAMQVRNGVALYRNPEARRMSSVFIVFPFFAALIANIAVPLEDDGPLGHSLLTGGIVIGSLVTLFICAYGAGLAEQRGRARLRAKQTEDTR